MKKIIPLFVLVLACFHLSVWHKKEVNRAFFNKSPQVQSTYIYTQSKTQINLIAADLLELTEDEMSHSEKKQLASLKSIFNGDSGCSFDFCKAVTGSKIKSTQPFIPSYANSQSFICNYRI